MIEKPFGADTASAEGLEQALSQIIPEERVFHIDHYMAKDTALEILDFRFKDGQLEDTWNSEHIEKIKVVFHESNIVGSRGPSYDGVGAFRDAGSNHMLELLAFTMMDQVVSGGGSIRQSRAGSLSQLDVDVGAPLVRAQYEGYLDEPGVEKDSSTETFFRVFLKSNADRWQGTEIELEGGKGLIDMHSDITTTTVSVYVYFKDGKIKEFKIQPVPGTLYDSYTKVYMDAIAQDQTLFVSQAEIMAEWKITDALMNAWATVPIIIYKKGSKPEEI
jgi:glucose-6-phosphate 1-dehydrogenase